MLSLTKRFLLGLLLMQWLLASLLPVWAEGEADPLWNRPSFEKKVITVGQRLLAANGITEKISFYSATRDIRNATASRWGGPNTVVIYKDLLDVIESDDELAAVLAHEIAHITKRHTGKIFPRRAVAKTAIWTTYTVGSTAAILATGGLAAAPVMLAGAGVRRMAQSGSDLTGPISRPFEREADIVGLEYMVKAGYNPLAMETLMTKVVGDAGPVAAFFSSHPVGSERLAYIHEEIVQQYPQFLSETSQDDPPHEPSDSGLPYTDNPPQTEQASQEALKATASKTIVSDSPATASEQRPDADSGAALLFLATSAKKNGQPGQKTSASEKRGVSQGMGGTSAPVDAKTGKNALRAAANATIGDNPAKSSPQSLNPTKAIRSSSAAGPVRPGRAAALSGASTGLSQPPRNPVNQSALVASGAEPVAVTLLSLEAHHLRILRMLSQRGYLSRKELDEQMEYLEEDTLTTALDDLIRKKLIRILGGEPDAVVVLTDRATEALKPTWVESGP